jgi:hypothetical protein
LPAAATDDPDHCVAANHRGAAYAVKQQLVGHFREGCILSDGDHLLGHQVGHVFLLDLRPVDRLEKLELADDAHQATFLINDRCTGYSVLQQTLDGIFYGRIGRDGDQTGVHHIACSTHRDAPD